MNIKNAVAALVLGASVLTGSSVFAAETLKLSHILDRGHPLHKSMELFAKRTGELSDGEIKIKIYPNGELGGHREVLELLQNGSIAMAQANVASLESFAKEYSAFGMPYLFKDREHFYRALQSSTGRSILRSSHDKGIVGLGYYDNGARSFYGRKAINVPGDLKGIKVRVQPSPLAIRMVELLGGSPTPLSYGELYTALQQGVVDGAENNLTALTLSRHGEVAKFFSADEHTMVPDVLIISAKIWDTLSEKNQKALEQAATEATLEMKKIWAETEAVEKVRAEKLGVTFNYPEKEPFYQAVKSMYDELKESDPAVYKLVEELRAQ